MSGGQKFVAGLKKFGGLNLIIGFFVALVADPQSPRLTLVVDDSCGNRYEGRDVLGNFVLINVRGRGNRKKRPYDCHCGGTCFLFHGPI